MQNSHNLYMTILNTKKKKFININKRGVKKKNNCKTFEK